MIRVLYQFNLLKFSNVMQQQQQLHLHQLHHLLQLNHGTNSLFQTISKTSLVDASIRSQQNATNGGKIIMVITVLNIATEDGVTLTQIQVFQLLNTLLEMHLTAMAMAFWKRH